MTTERAGLREAGPRCTCTPPDGVTRNHSNGCALFDVVIAYNQGWMDAALATPDEPGLDVERLAMMYEHHQGWYHPPGLPRPTAYEWARKFAAEYAETRSARP